MKNYRAPWSASLIIVSVLAMVLCLVAAGVLKWQTHARFGRFSLVPLALVAGAALFTIRGYAITADAILVRRLFWNTRLPLAGLRSAQFLPDAMRLSIRTFGNGGLFSFTGFYRNGQLGNYRAFVTDPRQTVVISPATPEAFVQELAVPGQGV